MTQKRQTKWVPNPNQDGWGWKETACKSSAPVPPVFEFDDLVAFVEGGHYYRVVSFDGLCGKAVRNSEPYDSVWFNIHTNAAFRHRTPKGAAPSRAGQWCLAERHWVDSGYHMLEDKCREPNGTELDARTWTWRVPK